MFFYLADKKASVSARDVRKGPTERAFWDKGGARKRTEVFMENAKKFTDIDGHYAQKHIEKLAAYGIVNGDGTGKFNPEELVTRADAAIMIANALTVCGK